MITITENLTTVTISVTQGQVGTQDISGKVDKIAGKGLSTEDYTTAEKTKLATLSNTGGNVDLSAYATNASVALKVDKVTGKSLINDTEITRLLTVTNFDNSVNVTSLSNKVDKVAGFTLTKNDFTDILKAKLDSITEIFTTALKTSYDTAVTWISTNGANVLNHVASTLNPHNVTKTQVGLSNVPNTDFTTAVAANTANLDLKVDKITGKGLSTEDYTTAEKTKLASLSTTSNGADLTDYAKIADLSSINITTQVPLAANTFYTSTTARAAVPTVNRKLGLTLLYSTANGVWIEEQYIGTTISTWTTAANWKIILINELNNFAITKAPTVTFTGRNVIFDAGVLEIRNAAASRSITFASTTTFNLGVSSAQRALVYDLPTSTLLVVVTTAIDKNLQVPLVYDDGTKLIDGILFRFVNSNNNKTSITTLTPNSENNRIFLSDSMISNREFPVLYSTLTQTPNTGINSTTGVIATSTKGYTIDLILNSAYKIITIPTIINVNDGYVFFDIAGKYITGRNYRFVPLDIFTEGQLVDIIIPENAYRIVFTVLNVVPNGRVYDNIFYSNLPIKNEVTRKVDKNLFMGKDLFLIEGQDLPIYRRSISNNSKIKRMVVSSKDALAKKTFANIDYSLAPSYQYFDEKLILNTNTIKSSKIDLLSIFEKDAINAFIDNGVDYLYGLTDININKVTPSALTGISSDILMIGGSTTNNGLPTYTRKYLTDLGITANFKGSINDDLGTSCEAIDGWGSDVYFGKRSLVGSIIVYPHTAAIPAGTTKPNPFLFLATATDKTNNPTYCYTFTPTGVAQETSYADYVGADRETRDFYIFSFSQYSTARAYINLDVVTLQLGINDISSNTYGLTDLQRFIPKFISEITATFPLAQVGIMPSAAFGAGTNGDDFYTRYIPYMNSLNLMVSTIANTRVKVLSTQVHSDRINQFDYLSTTALYSDGNLTKEIRTQGDAFHGENNYYLEVGKAVGMYVAWASAN